MTLQEYIEQNKNKEIEVLEDGTLKIKETEQTGWWKPVKYEHYFEITNSGIKVAEYLEEDYGVLMGNCFKKREEAENAVERLIIRAELLEAGGIETQNILIYKRYYRLMFDAKNVRNHVEIGCDSIAEGTIYPFEIVFKSKEEAEQAIEKVGEARIKKYLFGVEA